MLKNLMQLKLPIMQGKFFQSIEVPSTLLLFVGACGWGCGYFINPQAYLLTLISCCLLVVGYSWPWLACLGIKAELRFDRQRICASESIEIRLIIRNRWPFPVWGLVLRDVYADNQVDQVIWGSIPKVSARSQTELCWSWKPPGRGIYPRESLKLTTGFPFGLYEANCTIQTIGNLIVWPERTRLAIWPLTSGDIQQHTELSSQRTGQAGEQLATRQYRTGDSLRMIHWVQTARLDRFIVSERQAPAHSQVQILCFLDQDPACQQRNELALSIVASMVTSFHHQQTKSLVQLNDESYWVDQHERSLTLCMDRLAALKISNQTTETKPTVWQYEQNLATFAITTDNNAPLLVRLRSQRLVGWQIFDSTSNTANTAIGWYPLLLQDQALQDFSQQWRHLSREQWRGNKVVQCTAG